MWELDEAFKALVAAHPVRTRKGPVRTWLKALKYAGEVLLVAQETSNLQGSVRDRPPAQLPAGLVQFG